MNKVANTPAPGSRVISVCVLTLFLLAGLCVVALCCELSGCVRAAQAEKPLRAEPRLPKLTEESGGPAAPGVTLSLPELPPSEPGKTAPLPPIETMAPGRGEAEPGLVLPALPAAPGREEPPLLPVPVVQTLEPIVGVSVEVCSEPLVYLQRCAPQPLESPMLRNWKTLALYSLLAAIPAASAQAQQGPTTKDLEGIHRRLDQLEKSGLNTGDSLSKMQTDLRQMEEFRKAIQATPGVTQAELDRIKQRLALIDDIRKDLQRLDQLEGLQKDLLALGGRVQSLEERKPAAANGDLRGDIKELKGMLDKMIELQGSLQSDIKGVKQDVSGLKKEQGDTKLRVDAVELQVRVLTDDLKAMQKKLESNGTVAGSSPAPGIDRTLEEIRSRLSNIEQILSRMQSASNRIAGYAPTTGSVPAGTPTGRVLLENFYPEEMLFIVNGQMRRLSPNSVVSLDAVPAGSLTYEVASPTWGQRKRDTTNLAANETFRITAR